jgi:prolyl oligopeptidase
MMKYYAALLLATAAPALAAGLPGTQPAKIVPFTETVQGIPVDDPYRWMEGSDPAYTPWLKQQGDAASAWLKALPKRAELLKGISDRSGAVAGVGQIVERGPNLFLNKREAGAQTSVLVVRPVGGGPERVLFDPKSLDTPTATGHAINYWEASPDGRHLYIGASPGGSEEATLRIMDVATGKFVDGEVPLALFNGGGDFGGVYSQWLPDGSGFFYNRLQEGAKANDANYYLNTRLFFHRVGTPAASDRLILQRGRAGAPDMVDYEAPVLLPQPGSGRAILIIGDGVGRSLRLYTARVADIVAGKPGWSPIGSRDDRIEQFTSFGGDLYLLRRDKPRGRLVRLPAGSTDVAAAKEVVAESASTLDQVIATADGVYLVGRAPAGTELRLLGKDGRIAPVALPFSGASYLMDGNAAKPGLYVSLENYVTPRKRLRVVGTTVRDTGLGPLPPYPTDQYVMEPVEVTARDGAKVPLDIVHRRDAKPDGKRPVLLEAYAAYGINVDPYFNPRIYGLLDAGGVYAVAHARGGGELGRDWWQAGHKGTKPNTWRDVIDSAEWLNRSGWTSGKRITVWGTSAGGIMAGRAVTERPDLWAGAIASVGVMNAMRFEFGPNGKTNIAEFGSVATPEGAKALYAMDGYAHLKPGVAYPPMLLTAGANDPRVISWQPAKFAARLMTISPNPMIFQVDFDQGHGMGSLRSQLDAKAADIAAFTLWAAERNR